MNIRDLSRKYNVSMDTLRYYEKMELIGKPNRESNRRIYTDKEAKELEYILIAREGGIPLELLKKYMVANRDENVDVVEKRDLLLEEIEYIQENIKKQQLTINKINVFVERYNKVIEAREAKEQARLEREQTKEFKKEQARKEKEEARIQAKIAKLEAKNAKNQEGNNNGI